MDSIYLDFIEKFKFRGARAGFQFCKQTKLEVIKTSLWSLSVYHVGIPMVLAPLRQARGVPSNHLVKVRVSLRLSKWGAPCAPGRVRNSPPGRAPLRRQLRPAAEVQEVLRSQKTPQPPSELLYFRQRHSVLLRRLHAPVGQMLVLVIHFPPLLF
jgi:hypothetical protein